MVEECKNFLKDSEFVKFLYQNAFLSLVLSYVQLGDRSLEDTDLGPKKPLAKESQSTVNMKNTSEGKYRETKDLLQ